jgi:tRNA threonylcarbamoyladenosine biosynthesis protein TsaE
VRLDESGLQRWGVRIGSSVATPIVIGLRGPLGAGKSVLARSIGAGAGVSEAMPSPSYNLLLRYAGAPGREVVHLDLYRLDGPDELWELGWSQLGAEGEIVLVEWPERAEGDMPPDHWIIDLRVPDDEPLARDVEVHRVGHPSELPPFPMTVSTNG